jgi:RNA polymerase sigma factor (sigma-70 family)
METTVLAAKVVRRLGQTATVSEADAHTLLVERLLPRLHAYFCRLVGEQEAEDCLQEVLVRLEQSLADKTYDPSRSFNTWVWLKARTVWAQWCRQRQRTRSAPLALDPRSDRPADDPRRQDLQLDAAQVLEQVRDELGPEAFEMFVLYYEGDLTQDDVAELTDRDPKTVRKRIRQAHALIDRRLRG